MTQKCICRILSKKGMAPLKSLLLFFIMMLLLAFMVQIFMVYNICNTVNTSVRRAVMSVAAANKQDVFSSLREGNTFCDDVTSLVTASEIRDNMSDDLGLSSDEGSLEKLGSSGECFYKISGINVAVIDSTSMEHDINMVFEVTFDLEIPVSSFWDFGAFTIPMSVKSGYTAKY